MNDIIYSLQEMASFITVWHLVLFLIMIPMLSVPGILLFSFSFPKLKDKIIMMIDERKVSKNYKQIKTTIIKYKEIGKRHILLETEHEGVLYNIKVSRGEYSKNMTKFQVGSVIEIKHSETMGSVLLRKENIFSLILFFTFYGITFFISLYIFIITLFMIFLFFTLLILKFAYGF